MAQILERLQRLEDVVHSTKDLETASGLVEETDKSSPITHEDVVQNEVFHTIGRSDAAQSRASVEPEDEARDMEIAGSRQATKSEDGANFRFTCATIQELVFDLDLEDPVLTRISVVGRNVIRSICLPTREQAHVLSKTYSQSLGSWYHIYHRHTVEALLDETYNLLDRGHCPELQNVALLLSIFASGAYFHAFAGTSECAACGPGKANQIPLHWKQNTLDILDHIERSATPSSVEQLQATIIMSLLTQNFEGLSKKYWLLHCTSITLARDLSLHVLDHPKRKVERKSLIDAEVKRRIWWYLASTDWYVQPPLTRSAMLADNDVKVARKHARFTRGNVQHHSQTCLCQLPHERR